MDEPKWIPPNASPVRFINEEGYVFFTSLEEARKHRNAVVIFEGDTGGQIYLTAPVKDIHCSVPELESLLKDIDGFGWGDGEMYFEIRNTGEGVAGGMGGGIVTDGVWLHPNFMTNDFATFEISKRVNNVISGKWESLLQELPATAVFAKKRNILHLAVSYRHRQCVAIALSSSRADINHQDESGMTPLHLAVENIMTPEVEDLLRQGANPNIHDSYGRTPLHLSIYTTVQLVEILLAAGADPKVRTNRGRTITHLAAESYSFEMAERIIRLGLDINQLDFTARSPLYYANYCHSLAIRNRRHVPETQAIVDLFKSHGAIDIIPEHELRGKKKKP